MSPYKSWFRCIDPACARTYPIDQIIWRCESCGGLLEVEHDREAWRANVPDGGWRALFERRWRRNPRPYGSGVWGKHEWVLPEVDAANVVSFYEGGSDLWHADRYGRAIGVEDVWVKQCGESHTGSFKDLGMTVLVSMVAELRARGKDIPAMICASTGDTSAALASYGAAAGIPTVVMLPKGKVSTAQLVQPLANGALVLSLDTDFDGCMRLVQEVTSERNLYLANSMNSLRVEGQKTVAYEIIQQLDWQVPDWVIMPGGNLGNVSALGKGFLDLEAVGLLPRRPRIVCAQTAHADPLAVSYRKGWAPLEPQTARRTLANAIQIGNPVSFDKAVRILREFDGIAVSVPEQRLADASARADRAGGYTCPHTGVALGALEQLRADGTIKAGDRVVVVATAHGLKFTEFKVGYHDGSLDEVKAEHGNRPVEIPADLAAVWDAIAARVG